MPRTISAVCTLGGALAAAVAASTVAGEVPGPAGPGGNRGNFNSANINRGNINTGNINRNVNVSGGGGYYGAGWGGVAAGVAVGAAVGVAAASTLYHYPTARLHIAYTQITRTAGADGSPVKWSSRPCDLGAK